jgi:multiple sugar transport system ATP-binding protein
MEVAGKLMVAVSNAPIPAKVGEHLQFGVSAPHLHAFDAGTSEALPHGLGGRVSSGPRATKAKSRP